MEKQETPRHLQKRRGVAQVKAMAKTIYEKMTR